MEFLLLLLAGLALPVFVSSGSDDEALPEADDETRELSAATDADGTPIVQASSADNEISGADIIDFIESDESLSALPAGTVGIHAGDGDDTIEVGTYEIPVISGGNGDDVISGDAFQGDGPDVMNGNDGNDTIIGRGADVFGGAGDDVLAGGGNPEANDSREIWGEEGNDIISSGRHFAGGLAEIHGGLGDDTITGSVDDTITGDEGNDVITLTGVDATADGGIGDDTLTFEYLTDGSEGLDDPYAPLRTRVELTGGEGADEFSIMGEFDYISTDLSTQDTHLFATVTDFAPAEDTLFIDLSVTGEPTNVFDYEGYYQFNKEITFDGRSDGPEQGSFDLNFTLTAEDQVGNQLTRMIIIRIEGDGPEPDFDLLTATPTANGIAITFDQTAAA